MDQNNRKCTIIKHQDKNATILCSLSECEGSRWLCEYCLLEEIHRHGRNNNKHLKKKEQVLEQFEEKVKSLKNNQKQQKDDILHNLQRINEQISFLIKIVNDLQQELLKVLRDYVKQDLNQELQDLHQIMKENYFNMNNDQINQVFSFSSKQIEKNININYIQYILDKLLTNCYTLNQEFSNLQKSYLDSNDNIKNYELTSLERECNIQIVTFVQVSPNEQYIAIADNFGSLVLNNLVSNKQYAKTTLDKCVYYCEFSEDSQKLYVACKGGYLYKLNEQLIIMHSYQINQMVIQSLVVISDDYLLTSSNQTIVKLDIANKRQLLQISIGSVNIKFDRINDYIIGEINDSIQFWNQQGENILSKSNAHNHKIIQIQLIQNSQQLLSLDKEGTLKMWFMNLNQKDLILLNRIQDLNNKITSFYSIYNDIRIILYQEQGVYFVNQKMQNQKQLHKFTGIINYSNNLNIKQSKSVNYIPILSDDQIQVLKASQ